MVSNGNCPALGPCRGRESGPAHERQELEIELPGWVAPCRGPGRPSTSCPTPRTERIGTSATCALAALPICARLFLHCVRRMGFANGANRGQEEAHQDPQNGDDDEQLHERECRVFFTSNCHGTIPLRRSPAAVNAATIQTPAHTPNNNRFFTPCQSYSYRRHQASWRSRTCPRDCNRRISSRSCSSL